MLLLNSGWISISHQRQTGSAGRGSCRRTYLHISALGQRWDAAGYRRGRGQAGGSGRLHGRRCARVTRPLWGIGDQSLQFVVGVSIDRAGNGCERAQQLGRWQSSDSSQSRGRFGSGHIRNGWRRPRFDGDPRLGSSSFGRVASWGTRSLCELGLRIQGHQFAFAFRRRLRLGGWRLGCRIESSQLIVGGKILFVRSGGRLWYVRSGGRPWGRGLRGVGLRRRRCRWLDGLGSAGLLDQAGDGGIAGHALKSKNEPRVQHPARRGGQFADRRPTGQLAKSRRRTVVLEGRRAILALSLRSARRSSFIRFPLDRRTGHDDPKTRL